MQRVSDQIHLFRDFLITTWPRIDRLMEFHNWHDDGSLLLDWIQCNWELLVERELLGDKYLTPLSVTRSNRVINEQVNSDYSIVAVLETNLTDFWGNVVPKNKPLRLFGFCTSLEEGGLGIYPPFDYVDFVLDSTKELFALPIENLNFRLLKI